MRDLRALRTVVVAFLIALVAGNLAVRAQSAAPAAVGDTATAVALVGFASHTQVVAFDCGSGQWVLATFAQLKPGCEFYSNNRLYRAAEGGRAQVIANVDAGKLAEADLPYDTTSRRPGIMDVVQLLDKEMRPAGHALLSTVQPGATLRYQGRAYRVKADRSLADTQTVFSVATSALRRIEITRRGLQHVIDRHTVNGSKNAGTSIFNPGEDIQSLIRGAQLIVPVVESNGYVKREFDAGRTIGYDPTTGKRTSVYRVIATQTGKLVTTYPVAR